MRAVLHGFHEAWHEPLLTRLVAHLGIDECHYTYAEFQPTFAASVRTVPHRWDDLNWAHYPIDDNQLRPLDARVLDALARTETITLKMFDRLDPVRSRDYQTRKNLYLKHLRYWNHVVLEGRIDCFLSLNVPHEMFDYVLYAVCKLYGVATVIGVQSQVADTMLVVDDCEDFSDFLAAPLAAARQRYASTPEADIPLAPRMAREYATQTGTAPPTPFYMSLSPAPASTTPARASSTLQHAFHTASRVLKKSASDWRNTARAIFEQKEHLRLGRELHATYERVARTPDLDRPYIYLPLHFQPEMTTSPLAGAFVDQVLIAELLAATMPPHVQLYVKEHPKQVDFSGRYEGYYEALRALPRTTLVPKSFDTYALIDRSAAVATATGTAGWEALFRGKPVLLFGSNFYESATGVLRVRSVEDSRSAMRKVFQEGLSPTHKDAKLFLAALESVSSEGYLWEVFKGVSAVSPETNLENVFALLSGAIGRAVSKKPPA